MRESMYLDEREFTYMCESMYIHEREYVPLYMCESIYLHVRESDLHVRGREYVLTWVKEWVCGGKSEKL